MHDSIAGSKEETKEYMKCISHSETYKLPNYNTNLNVWNGVLLRKCKYYIGCLHICNWEVDKFSLKCVLFEGEVTGSKKAVSPRMHIQVWGLAYME